MSFDHTKPAFAYLITNKVNGKRYVGVTVNVVARLRQHRSPSSGCVALRSAIAKYGWESFQVSVICEFQSLTEALSVEPKLIAEFKSKSPLGYNVTNGGQGTSGHTWSSEAKKRFSIYRRNNPRCNTEHQKAVAALVCKARNSTPEMRAARSKAWLGRYVPPSTRRKISASKKGKAAYGIAVEVNGKTYPSLKAAGDDIGESKAVIWYRVKAGMAGYVRLGQHNFNKDL